MFYFVFLHENSTMTELNKKKAVLNWSSGKDAAMAYHLLQQSNEYKVVQLLTTVNAEQDRVVMHGVREELLDAQADRIGVPLKKIKLPPSPDHEGYSNAMQEAMNELKESEIYTSVFGDIFLEDLKEYREQQLNGVGMQGLFPLWKRDTTELVRQVEDAGIEAMIVCANAKLLGKEFLGRKLDRSLLNDLPAGVDPCGENGEFHTFVYNAPFFKSPIVVKKGTIVERTYKNEADSCFYFLDLEL